MASPSPVRPGPFLLASLAAAAGFAAVYLVFVRTNAGQNLDERGLLESAAMFGAWSRTTLAFLNGMPAFSVVLAAAALCWAALIRRRWVASAIALVSALAANAATYVLKQYVLDRPDLGHNALGGNSMPSGHATLAASAAAAVYLAVTPRYRPLAAFAGATYAVLAGVVMLVNQWHLAADVVAAFLLVAAIAAPATWLALRTERASGTPPQLRIRWERVSLRIALGAAVVAALALMLVLVVPPEGWRVGTVPQFFAAGAAAITASGYACSAAACRLVTRAARRSHTASARP
ncbi:phosphatase PAP2 family protein [Sinomonas sp. ASV486]|uniref:phosphatase PAP2 family protein n=1 Tax=Sinomonas sp. ASV486 TaxID=3051170 RepID=UPI0027DE6DEB|nr:phosphatase PAP2 family protein [Sinomonas sp. ASV486]MDQ4488609.1 phosphatase PAP2 family protein [Sinomonas sp. ASV486]